MAQYEGMLSSETVELISQLAEERNAYKRFTDELCELFQVPVAERQKPYIASQIIDRIHQLQTAYTIRKSLIERESGAAFRTPASPEVTKEPLDK